MQTVHELAFGVHDIHIVRHVGAGVEVKEIFASARRCHVVGTMLFGELGDGAATDVHHVAVAFQRADLGGAVENLATVVREAVEVGDDEIALGELLAGAFADGI